ncbi:hypothetical protein [Enterovibrio sp. FF113]|uniref:hypothetical protein n=1 Tax=Enterovibrio sp. FF113 TaxID=3230010 RepID=UPI00352F389A
MIELSPSRVEYKIADQTYLESLCITISSGMRVLDLSQRSDAFSRYCLFWGASVDKQIGVGHHYDVVHLDVNALSEKEFESSLEAIFRTLSANGVLLFGGEVAGQGKAWRQIGDGYLPSFANLKNKLNGHAWKMLGVVNNDVSTPNNHAQWMFFHVSVIKPTAFLLLGSPGVGKSTMARRHFSHLPVVQGDQIYKAIFDGKLTVSQQFREEIQSLFDPCRILRMTLSLFEKGYFDELMDVWLQNAKYQDVVIDSYVPPKYHKRVRDRFSDAGYVAIDMRWELSKTMCSKRAAEENVSVFMRGNSPLVEAPVSRRFSLAAATGFIRKLISR